MSDATDLEAVLEPKDREHAARLDPGERDIVVSTMARYRKPETLRVGDSVPALELTRLVSGESVRLDEIAREQPLVLVFGSFT